MHLHFNHRHIILQQIHQYFQQLSQLSAQPSKNKRSKKAKKRRNVYRHAKTKVKHQQFTMKRPVDILWKPKHIKSIFKQFQLQYARILEVHNHILTIQFDNPTDRDTADAILPDNIFNADHFHQYFPQEH